MLKGIAVALYPSEERACKLGKPFSKSLDPELWVLLLLLAASSPSCVPFRDEVWFKGEFERRDRGTFATACRSLFLVADVSFSTSMVESASGVDGSRTVSS